MELTYEEHDYINIKIKLAFTNRFVKNTQIQYLMNSELKDLSKRIDENRLDKIEKIIDDMDMTLEFVNTFNNIKNKITTEMEQ